MKILESQRVTLCKFFYFRKEENRIIRKKKEDEQELKIKEA